MWAGLVKAGCWGSANEQGVQDRLLRWCYLLIALIPLTFTVLSWAAADGVPYFTDNNETYSAYAHSRNMDMFGVSHNAMLTDDAVGLHPGAHPFTYTHQGNLPRYFSYVFRKIGITGLPAQVLLAAIISIALTFWLGRVAFKSTPWVGLAPMIMFLVATDFLAVLEWYGNLFRTWHMPLFFAVFACVYWRQKYWLAALSVFLLFQMEFSFAVFTTTAVLGTIAVTRRQTGSLAMAAVIMAAAGVSVAVFIGQLVLHLGWDGFLYDISTTYRARNSNTVDWEEIKAFYLSNKLVMWPSFADTNHGFGRYLTVTGRYGAIMYGRGIWPIACFGIFVSAFLWIGRGLAGHWFVAPRPLARLAEVNGRLSVLLWPMIGAYLVVGVVLSGYTMSSYIQRWGPVLNFPVMLAVIAAMVFLAEGLAIAASSAASVIGRPNWSVGVGRVATVGLLGGVALLWCGNSLDQYRAHPLFRHEPAKILATKYQGESFVSNTTYPHMISHYTGKWSYYSPLEFDGTAALDETYNWNGDRMANPEYLKPTYYLCQRVPYRSDVDCGKVAERMVALGHELTDKGQTFAILRLAWKLESSPPVAEVKH